MQTGKKTRTYVLLELSVAGEADHGPADQLLVVEHLLVAKVPRSALRLLRRLSPGLFYVLFYGGKRGGNVMIYKKNKKIHDKRRGPKQKKGATVDERVCLAHARGVQNISGQGPGKSKYSGSGTLR